MIRVGNVAKLMAVSVEQNQWQDQVTNRDDRWRGKLASFPRGTHDSITPNPLIPFLSSLVGMVHRPAIHIDHAEQHGPHPAGCVSQGEKVGQVKLVNHREVFRGRWLHHCRGSVCALNSCQDPEDRSSSLDQSLGGMQSLNYRSVLSNVKFVLVSVAGYGSY